MNQNASQKIEGTKEIKEYKRSTDVLFRGSNKTYSNTQPIPSNHNRSLSLRHYSLVLLNVVLAAIAKAFFSPLKKKL